MPSVFWRGSRGLRMVSPLFHIVFIGTLALVHRMVCEWDREDFVRTPPPPVAAPPSSAASLVNMMEMQYRKGFNQQNPIVQK